jgi:hypothetical protein
LLPVRPERVVILSVAVLQAGRRDDASKVTLIAKLHLYPGFSALF